ncbi:MAG: GNAT family N-acetyltransferase [Myxococcales bacterium]|nr:GNAT family N-acetyltransferase [Myxococcales bacterium]
MPTIRPVTDADLDAVRRVLVETWHATYDAIMGAERVTAITDDWHAVDRLRRQVDRPQAPFLLVEASDGAVIATGSAHREGEVAHVDRLYVRPDQHGRGVGTALLDALLRDAGAAARVELRVQQRNDGALAFYRRRGFSIVRPEDDDWVMELRPPDAPAG